MLERSQGWTLGSRGRETRGKEAPGWWGVAVAVPVKLSLILPAVKLVSPLSPTWAGVTVTNQFICELSPSTRRKKKMQREPVQLQAKGREDAMCLASPAVVCSCFALSCLLQLKPKQTALPAGANRKEIIGRGVVEGGQRLPSGSWASWDHSAQLGDIPWALSPVTGSALAKLSCCNVVCVNCSFHPVRKTWTCMKFIACTCWAFFLFLNLYHIF